MLVEVLFHRLEAFAQLGGDRIDHFLRAFLKFLEEKLLMFINIPNNPFKTNLIIDIITIVSNIAISNKKNTELIVQKTKIPQLIKQILFAFLSIS